jgi:hypothetical protein
MSDKLHSVPLIIHDIPIVRTPDTVTHFVLGNVALVATLSVEEKIQMLRTLSENNRPEVRRNTCDRIARAAVLLLRDTRHHQADLGLIAKALGGSRWLRVQMNRITDNELRIIVQEAIHQADIANEPQDRGKKSAQSVANVLKKISETSQQITSNLK